MYFHVFLWRFGLPFGEPTGRVRAGDTSYTLDGLRMWKIFEHEALVEEQSMIATGEQNLQATVAQIQPTHQLRWSGWRTVYFWQTLTVTRWKPEPALSGMEASACCGQSGTRQ